MKQLLITFCLLLPTSWASAQSLAFLQTATSGASNTTYTFASQNLGAAASDRCIIITSSLRDSSGFVVSSITVGGVTATITNNHFNSPEVNTVIAIAEVPTGTTGDVVVTMTGTTARCAVDMYRATGLASTTPTDTANTGTVANENPQSAELDKAEGITIGVCCTNASGATFTWGNLATKDTDADLESQSFSSASEESTAATQTITCTRDSGGTRTAMSLATWEYASGSNIPLIHYYRQMMGR